MPPTRQICCSATGPQSKVFVSTKIVSVASSSAPATAAQYPEMRRSRRKKSQMVAAPIRMTGTRVETAEGVKIRNNPV